MEQMATAITDCLKGAKFGGRYIDVYWGLKENRWIFDDKEEAKKFMSMTEFNKEVSGMLYQVKRTPLL